MSLSVWPRQLRGTSWEKAEADLVESHIVCCSLPNCVDWNTHFSWTSSTAPLMDGGIQCKRRKVTKAD